MEQSEFPSSWRDPRYVATLVGIIVLGTVFVYVAITDTGISPELLAYALLAFLIPMVVAYAIAIRLNS